MQQIYVLDTNVLIHDPRAVYAFSGATVVIPVTVTEELDRLKTKEGSLGQHAREASRVLETIRLQGPTSLKVGVRLENNSTLRFGFLEKNWNSGLPLELTDEIADNRILGVAYSIREESDENEFKVTLVSKDVNLRLKAGSIGLMSEDYDIGRVEVSELYTGLEEVVVTAEEKNNLFSQGSMQPHKELYANQAIIVRNANDWEHTSLAMVDGETGLINPIRDKFDEPVSGLYPKNAGQKLALKLLTDDSINLVTLVGKAGTGKTLLALAAAISRTADHRKYDKILVTRPVVPMGRDLGYLPGEIGDKMEPWIKPIRDSLEVICDKPKDRHGNKYGLADFLTERGLLEIEALTYIRGRSLPNVFFIIDEAQNLHPHELKTIITRAGEGTKIVLTGDIGQIDNPYLDPISNGLTYVVERAKNYSKAGHITLFEGERSELAEWASENL